MLLDWILTQYGYINRHQIYCINGQNILPLLSNFEFILIFIQWKIWLGNNRNGNFGEDLFTFKVM